MKKGHSKVRWGDCLKYLIRGWNRKEGRGNKDLKKGTSWVKGGGVLEPLYELWIQGYYILFFVLDINFQHKAFI